MRIKELTAAEGPRYTHKTLTAIGRRLRSADVVASPGGSIVRVEPHFRTSAGRTAVTQPFLVVSEAVAGVAIESAVAVDGLDEVLVGSAMAAGDADVWVSCDVQQNGGFES